MRVSASSTTSMAHHIDISDKAAQKDGRNAIVKRNWFIKPEEHDGLACYRIEIPESGSVAAAHFHLQDQFQVFVDGEGSRMGADPVPPFTVQYADACTPYGPIVCGPKGVAFFVFRLRKDAGAFVMPAERSKMTQRPGRIVMATMPPRNNAIPDGGVEALAKPHADGLGVYRIAAPAGGKVTTPDPSTGGGQYVLIANGSVRQGNEEFPARSCLFVSPDEPALELVAGAAGFNAVLLQFPKQSWAQRMAETAH